MGLESFYLTKKKIVPRNNYLMDSNDACPLPRFSFQTLSLCLYIATLQPLALASDAQVARVSSGPWNIVNSSAWPITGSVTFAQAVNSENVTVQVSLAGLPAGTAHGIHIHAVGNLSNGCLAAGSHFNPYNHPHGARSNTVLGRHVGDLGNVFADSEGRVVLTFVDSIVSLGVGTSTDTLNRSIIGRTLILHSGEDDGGVGPNPPFGTSNTTGNAGARVACALLISIPPGSSTGSAANMPPGKVALIVFIVLAILGGAGGVWVWRHLSLVRDFLGCAKKAPNEAVELAEYNNHTLLP